MRETDSARTFAEVSAGRSFNVVAVELISFLCFIGPVMIVCQCSEILSTLAFFLTAASVTELNLLLSVGLFFHWMLQRRTEGNCKVDQLGDNIFFYKAHLSCT